MGPFRPSGESMHDRSMAKLDRAVARLQAEIRERELAGDFFVELEREFQTRIGVQVLDAELEDRFGPVQL